MEKNQSKSSPTKSVGGVGPVSDVVTKRLDKLEITAGVVEKLEREVRNNAEMTSDTKTQLTRLKDSLGDTVSRTEEKLSREAKNNISFFEKELAKTTTIANNAKHSADDVERKVERLGKIFQNIFEYLKYSPKLSAF